MMDKDNFVNVFIESKGNLYVVNVLSLINFK